MSDAAGPPDFTKRPDEPADQPPPPPPPAYGQQPPPAYGQQPTPPYGQPQQPPYGQQFGGPVGGMMRPDQERTWGCAAHWSALVGSVVALAFLGPLIVMLTKGNESPWVRRQAVESLNFQLSMLIYAIASLVLWLVIIGIVLSFVVAVLWLVFTVLATVKTANGEDYRYPLTIRMVS